jgi:hypothetical protein
MDSDGICRQPCGETLGPCPSGQICKDSGLCGCDDDAPCVGEGTRRDLESCRCVCEEGYKRGADGGCVKCSSGELCPGGDEDDGEEEEEEEGPARRMIVPPEGCGKSWPECAGAALVEGRVIRLYEDAIPCKIETVFSVKMPNPFAFEEALRKCATTQRCDGLWTCDSSLSAIGFAFVDPGGKAENGSSRAQGNATFLKDGSGACGPKGKPQRFGDCAPLSSFPSAMRMDQKAGTMEFPGHSFCDGDPLPFQNSGLPEFNFTKDSSGAPDLSTMVVRRESDALLCKELCKLDVRCDAVQTTDNTCRMFRRRFDQTPSLRPSPGVDTTFVRLPSGARMTRIAVLREMGDPEDHGDDGGDVVYVPNLFLRVWDQYDDHARVENLLQDGLLEGHEYTLIPEGSTASTALTVTVRWDESVRDVKVSNSASPVGGFVPVKGISAIRFTAPRTGHLREFLWLEDENKRRSQQATERKQGEARGTTTEVKNGTINVYSGAPVRAADMSHGSIVIAGAVASRENAKKLPPASAVMDALQLADVMVEKTGAHYRWRPMTKSGNKAWKQVGDGRWIIKDLSFPKLGEGSVATVFAGPSADDQVPVTRISGRGAEDISVPIPPAGYDAWFAAAPPEATKTRRVEQADSTAEFCARKCDEENANPGAEVKCASFRVTAGGCDLMEWEPSKAAKQGESGGLVFHRHASRTPAAKTDIIADIVRGAGEGAAPSVFADWHFSNYFPEFANQKKMMKFNCYVNRDWHMLDENGHLSVENRFYPGGGLLVVPSSINYHIPLYNIHMGDRYLDASSTNGVKSNAKIGSQIGDVESENYSFAIIHQKQLQPSADKHQMVMCILWNPFHEVALAHYANKTVQWVRFTKDDKYDPIIGWNVTVFMPFSPIFSAHAANGVTKGCISHQRKDNMHVNENEKDCGNDDSLFTIFNTDKNNYYIKSRKEGNTYLCRRKDANTIDVDSLPFDETYCRWSIVKNGDKYQFLDFQNRYLQKNTKDLDTTADGSNPSTWWTIEDGNSPPMMSL